MLEIIVFGRLPVDTQDEFARKIAQYTNGLEGEQPQMLPVEPDDVRQRLGLVALYNKEFAGYISATDPIEHNGSSMSEVGTLWVPRQYRGQKIATMLGVCMNVLLEKDGVTPYVFCNPLSNGVFTGIGFVPATGDDLPSGAFDACAICPVRPATGCCDVILKKESLYGGN